MIKIQTLSRAEGRKQIYDHEKMKELFASGMSVIDIACELRCATETVRKAVLIRNPGSRSSRLVRSQNEVKGLKERIKELTSQLNEKDSENKELRDLILFLKTNLQEKPSFFKGEEELITFIETHAQELVGLGPEHLRAKNRKREVVLGRYITFYLLKRYTERSFRLIGEYFNPVILDHSTVIHGIGVIENMMDCDKTFRLKMQALMKTIDYRSSKYQDG